MFPSGYGKAFKLYTEHIDCLIGILGSEDNSRKCMLSSLTTASSCQLTFTNSLLSSPT